MPLLVLGLGTSALLIWSSVIMWQMPDDGGIFASSNGRIASVDAGGIASKAGIRVGDRLIAIDGVRLQQVQALYWGLKAGDTVVYTIERNGKRLQIPLALGTPSLADRLARLEQVFIGATFFVVSIAAWALWPSDTVARRFYVLSQVLAAALALELLDSMRWPFTGILCGIFTVLLAPLALHFLAAFPGMITMRSRRWWVGMAYIVGALLAIWTGVSTYTHNGWAVSEPLLFVRRLYIVATLSIVVTLLVRRLFTHREGGVSSRRLVLIGMAASLLPLLTLSFLPHLLRGSPLVGYTWTIPLLALLPGTYAFTSFDRLRKQLTEAERVRDELTETRRRLVEQREAERAELARELHDGPVQELLWVQTQLRRLERKLIEQPSNPGLEELRGQLQQTISELRTIGLDLRPPILAEYGLRAAIEWHCGLMGQKYPELHIGLDLADDAQTLPEHDRVALFRIYQEALQNVVKHASATRVDVRFILDDKMALLEVSDNGRGFQVPERWGDLVWGGHIGLIGITERAEAIGARWEVLSQPSSGTTVRVAVPGSRNAEGTTTEGVKLYERGT